jgi:hypothetical protein
MTTLGFTSNFVAILEDSRRKVDDFVETNKRTADCRVADLKKLQADEQQNIDALLRQLKSLQYERGVATMSRNGSDDNATGGLAVRLKKFESKQVKLQEELSMLKSKNRIEQAQLDGAYCSVNANVVLIYPLLNLTDHVLHFSQTDSLIQRYWRKKPLFIKRRMKLEQRRRRSNWQEISH